MHVVCADSCTDKNSHKLFVPGVLYSNGFKTVPNKKNI